jgi:hypothetical protein
VVFNDVFQIQRLFYLAIYELWGAGIAQSVEQLGYRLNDLGVRSLYSGNAKKKNFLHNVQTGSGAHPGFLYNGYRGLFPQGQSGRGVKLTIHFHRVRWLIMVELYLY